MEDEEMQYEEAQRAITDEELMNILSGIKLERPDLFEEAQDVFTRFVDPHVLHEQEYVESEKNAMDTLFTEWFFYDYELGMELSPLQLYSIMEPTVEEYADTQFFSQFWVITQNRRTGEVRLRDTRTCEDFTVFDKEIACQRTWSHGLLGTRIARVGGTWQTCGRFRPHDNCRTKPAPASRRSYEGMRYDRFAMLTLGAELIGENGEYRESVTEHVLVEQ